MIAIIEIIKILKLILGNIRNSNLISRLIHVLPIVPKIVPETSEVPVMSDVRSPYQKYLARSCQDVSRFGKLARNLFQIHANFSNLQESFLSCKILVPNPCENLVLLDFWPDSCKILKRSCQDSFQDLGKIFS